MVEVNKRWTSALWATSTKRTPGPTLLLVLAHPQSEISIISVFVTIIVTTSAAPAAQHQLSSSFIKQPQGQAYFLNSPDVHL